jgi:hypothetical protein
VSLLYCVSSVFCFCICFILLLRGPVFLTRTSIPNPLFDLITIYDEEESSEVPLVTPVHIIELKEPKKASTPGPNASIKNLPQSDHEVESVLDIELLNLPGTQIDNSRDELGSGGKKEKISQ